MVVRYKSRVTWFVDTFKKVFFHQFLSGVAVFLLICLSGHIYCINITITKNIVIYCVVLFVYLLIINSFVLLAMTVIRKPSVSISFGMLVNTAFLLIQHYYINIENCYQKLLCIQTALVFIIWYLIFILFVDSDIYINRNDLYVFEK